MQVNYKAMLYSRSNECFRNFCPHLIAGYNLKSPTVMGLFLRKIQYSDFQDVFLVSGIALSPSELHGLMTGFMCVNSDSSPEQREVAYSDWLIGDGERADAELVQWLDQLFEATLTELEEFSDFQFRILMPDDDTCIDARSQALKSFCAGFLSGVGPYHFDEEVTEALTDLERIAALRGEVGESEENESDLFEIIEFVRVSVFFIFTENARRR